MKPKYLWLVAAAALSLGACSTDNTTDPELTPPHKNGYKISFTVAEDSETRTTLDEGDVLRWVSTDQVGIYTFGHSVNANNLTVAEVDQSPVVFSGDLQESVSSGDMFYAYYPYNARQSGNHREVKLSIPAEQTQTAAGVYNGESNPLVAVPMAIDREQSGNPVRIGSVRFRQLGAIVELQLSSSGEAIRTEKIRSVTFESETALAGDFKFNLTTVTVDGELSIEGYKLTKVKTTLDAPAAIPATGDGAARVYLTIAPGTYSGQIVVETDAAQYTFTLADAMTFKRAVIKGLPADLAEATRGTSISFKDDKVKEICIANWDTGKDGELSYQEAAAVMDLGQVFRENTAITSFDELQYFTGLKSIGYQAFYVCRGLTNIKIPEGVTEIGTDAFSNCNNLASITLPNTLTTIGTGAFAYCSSMKSIDIPAGVTEIGSYAFANCSSLAKIELPKGVTKIGVATFRSCHSLTNIDIPAGVTEIGGEAFQDCVNLVSINIPEGVTKIENATFRECERLERITIPAGVTEIKEEAFFRSRRLTSVYCNPTTPPTLGRDVFKSTSLSQIYVPATSVDTYKTANGWSDYADRIFADINDPISFVDQNVKQICLQQPWNTNSDTELSYKEAAAVTVLGQVFSRNGAITSFDELQYFTGLQSIGSNAFYYCDKLTSIKIPDGVTEIESKVFYGCDKLTNITLPNTLTTIGSNALWGCLGLTDITLPEGVKEIGMEAFASCSNLVSITLPNTLTTIGDGAFGFCSSLESINIPAGVTTIGVSAFIKCSSLANITLPNTLTTIESSAFQGCSSLANITLPNTLTTIESSAFKGCSSLASINIPAGVTKIEYATFKDCRGLERVIISAGVKEIGEDAFMSCSKLTSVYCKPTAPPSLGRDAFQGIPRSMTIYVPVASINTYKGASGWSEFAGQIVADND